MGYHRGTRIRPPEELVDAWLLARFPGRTLEELDDLDWARLNRALEAAHIERVLDRERLYRAGKLTASDLSDSEWALLRDLAAAADADQGSNE